MKITIYPNGEVRFLHDDRLIGLRNSFEGFVIERASNVEPTQNGNWTADMALVGGPVLGSYDSRAEALEKEMQWLAERNFPMPKDFVNQKQAQPESE